ncbi:Ras- protein Rab-19 [Paramecium bursaria]
MEEQLFKIVFIGNSAVGKSSLLIRFCDDQFRDMYLSTIGVDFRFKTLKVNNQGVKLQIWDTAGQERFRNITNSYYKGAQGIVLVYDLTNIKSFNDIKSCWMNELQHYADENVLLMLLGNKSDLANEETRQVSVEMAEEYAKEHNMKHFEVSAKTAEQVTQAFHDFTEKILANASTLKQKKPQQQLNNSNKQEEKSANSSCC